MQQNSDSNHNIVEINDLGFSRGSHIVFKGVNLQVQRGKITAVLGPSGSGKTTLLRLIGGQVYPDEGTVKVDGKNIPDLSRDELYQIRRRMGMLFQSGALFTHLTVFENVAFPLREHTLLPERMIRDLVLMKLQAVGLRGARDLMPAQLSGGMARRVALARALALDPELIMFDEPFAGQDPITMGVLVKLIRSLSDLLNMTTILVSHDVDETLSIADFVYVIADGRIIGSGTPKNLVENATGWVKQFIEGLPDGPVPFHYPAMDYEKDLLEGS